MSKLFGAFSACENTGNKSRRNRQALKTSAKSGLVKPLYLGAAALLAIILAGFSAPAYGQAVNATLLGTVTDTTGAVVAGAKVTATEMKTGIMSSPIFPQVNMRSPSRNRDSREPCDLESMWS